MTTTNRLGAKVPHCDDCERPADIRRIDDNPAVPGTGELCPGCEVRRIRSNPGRKNAYLRLYA